MNVIFLCICIFIYIYIIEIVCVLLDSTKQNLYIGGCLEYVANIHGYGFLMKVAPPPSRGCYPNTFLSTPTSCRI